MLLIKRLWPAVRNSLTMNAQNNKVNGVTSDVGITPVTQLHVYITNESCRLQIFTICKEEFVSQAPLYKV